MTIRTRIAAATAAAVFSLTALVGCSTDTSPRPLRPQQRSRWWPPRERPRSSRPTRACTQPQGAADLTGTEIVDIALDGTGATGDSDDVTVKDSTVTITAAGTYRLSGDLDGQVVVDAPTTESVRLVLDGADITSSSTAAIAAVNAESLVVVLADGSENTLSDTNTYAEDADVNAALFSAGDLTIAGTGALTVTATATTRSPARTAWSSRPVRSPSTAVDDGIRGKDYLVVNGGTITVTSGGDGLKADNPTRPTPATSRRRRHHHGQGRRGRRRRGDRPGRHRRHGEGHRGRRQRHRAHRRHLHQGPEVRRHHRPRGRHDHRRRRRRRGAQRRRRAPRRRHGHRGQRRRRRARRGRARDRQRHRDGDQGRPKGWRRPTSPSTAGDVTVTTSDDGVNAAGGTTEAERHRPRRRRPAAAASRRRLLGGGHRRHRWSSTPRATASTPTATPASPAAPWWSTDPRATATAPWTSTATSTVSGGTLLAAGSAGMVVAPAEGSSQAWIAASVDSGITAGSVVQVVENDKVLATFTTTKAAQSIVYSSAALAQGEAYEIYIGGTATGSSVGGLAQSGELGSATQVGSATEGEAPAGGGRGFGGGGQRPNR